METFEFRAYFPADPHDTWVQGGFTPWESEAELLKRLQQRSKLPRGLEDVKVYKRQVFPSVEVTDEFIKLEVSSSL